LIDAHLGVYDGFDLATRIREEYPNHVDTVVMLLDSGNISGEFARCEKLGISVYLMKPVNESELFDTLVAVLSGSAAETVSETRPNDGNGRVLALHVLLAEDSLYNQKLAVGLLSRRGHAVTVANNGREAVEILASQEFDAVLMDVQMPEMDGLAATRIIRERERETGRHIPIIAMTAQAMKGDRERCLEAGMDDYLVKPVRSKELYETLESLATNADRSSIFAGDEEAGEGRTLDWATALSSVDSDRGLLKDIIDAFLDECPRLLNDVEQSIRGGDAATLRRVAHTIKGATRTFGANSAGELAESLETMGRCGELANAEPMFSRLKQRLDELSSELVAFVEKTDTLETH
jgi:CheY-like chemotaxis protein/HPt (histidine-containing phosphotransfer) domain-containing protein